LWNSEFLKNDQINKNLSIKMEDKKCIGTIKDGTRCSLNKKIGDYCTAHFKFLREEKVVKKFKLNIINNKNDILLKEFLILRDSLEDKGYENLLINKYPNLIKEWDFVENNKNNINLLTITFSSHKKVSWLCLDNGHKPYKTSLNSKTQISRKTSGCPDCAKESRRIFDLDLLEKNKKNHNPTIDTTKIGDESEKYIFDLLKNTNIYKELDIVGNKGGKGDIKIIHNDDSINYIQIKTITFTKEETFYMTNDHVYDDDMLIVMVNKKRDRFALEFAGKIKVKRLSLSFKNQKGKYKDIMFKNKEDFLNKLLELIPLSTKINEITSLISKEIDMFIRLETFCKENGMKFTRNSTNGNTVDGFINGYTFQGKYRSDNGIHRKTYSIDSNKSSGRINGKNRVKNYEVGDFDFIIVEVGGTKEEPDKYKGNFWIAHSKSLEEQEILSNGSNIKGKKMFLY